MGGIATDPFQNKLRVGTGPCIQRGMAGFVATKRHESPEQEMESLKPAPFYLDPTITLPDRPIAPDEKHLEAVADVT